MLTAANIRVELREADVVIGAVLVPGGRTPLLISREMLAGMKRGAVIVDVSVDQGGCAATRVLEVITTRMSGWKWRAG